MGVAALGVRDSGGGWGGALGFRWRLASSLAVRIGADVRAGQIAAAQTTNWFFSGGAGIAWNLLASENGRRSLGLRLDALLVRQEFTHLSNDDAKRVYQGKWLPGGDLLLEAAWFFTDGAGLCAAAGAQGVAGKTDVIVRGQRVTTVQPIRPLLEVGVRTRF
jgi:hypothetical protein